MTTAVIAGAWALCRHWQVRELIVGAHRAAPDLFWVGDGEVQGMAREVLDEAARRGGYRLKWKKLPPATGGCDAAIREGTVDLCPAVGALPWRIAEFHVTRPWLRNDFCLISNAKKKVVFAQADQSVRLSHVRGPVTILQVDRMLPKVKKVQAGSRIEALRMLCRGESDAAVMDVEVFQSMLYSRPTDCNGVQFYSELLRGGSVDLALAGPKNRASILEDLRGHIDGLVADGTLASQLTRWHPMSLRDTESLYQEQAQLWRTTQIKQGVAAAAFLVLVLLVMNRRISAARKVAERAAAARSEFIANMSHEIRTPLSGVLSTAELLRGCEIDDEAREYVEIIHESGRSLQQLLTDMLDLKKIEAGKLSIEIQDFALRRALQCVIEAFQGSASEKGIGLRLEIDAGVPTFVSGDALRLRQIASNLVGNAVKFTDKGGVTLSVKWTGTLRIEVRDTGIGIAPGVLPLLFGKFVQADSSITRRFGGTGLGLSLCKALVEAMDGRIGVTSLEGEGSEFWFELPWGEAQPVAESAKSAEIFATGAMAQAPARLVLLAEDNRTNQLIVRRFLEKAGCELDVVENGEQAVLQVQRRPYDLVLMDCFMPVMDGYEATRRIRAQGGHSATMPIIALTAAAMESDHQKALRAGMNDFVTKPINSAELLGAVARWSLKQGPSAIQKLSEAVQRN